MQHVTEPLDRVIFGRSVVEGQPADNLDVIALSAGFSLEEARTLRNFVALDPLPQPTVAESQAIGIFHGPGSDFILARAHCAPETPDLQVYEAILLPGDLVGMLAGDLLSLLALIEEPISARPSGAVTSIPTLEMPHAPTWTEDKRVALFNRAFSDYGDMTTLLALLGAALDERYLLLRNFAGGFASRVELVQGLMMLLPSSTRAEQTFATNVRDVTTASTRVVFSDGAGFTRRLVADLAAGIYPNHGVLDSPYIRQLAALWNGELAGFFAALKPLEYVAPYLVTNSNLEAGLTRVAERYALDRQVMDGQDLPIDTLKAILSDRVPLYGELPTRYASQLLNRALAERDTEAAILVARYMDEHPEVDTALSAALAEAAEVQPDAVYVFVRSRLGEGVDSRWLPRLKRAAERSLDIAVKDGDSATLARWLKLISREPVSYALGAVLHEGILAAQGRAHEDGDLGSQLVTLAVKRDPDALDTLLEDGELVSMLTNTIGGALRDFDPEAVLALKGQGREIFLVALARAARARMSAVFTPAVVESFWEIYTSGQPAHLPAHFLPDSVIREWVDHGVDWLSAETIETLLVLILAGGRDDLFYQLSHHLSERQLLFPLLPVVLQRSARSVPEVVNLVTQLMTAGDISQQQALNAVVALLEAWEWQEATFPLVEQAARMIHQSPTLAITPDVCWHLLDVAAEMRSESVARAATQRLLPHIQTQTDETGVVGLLLHLIGLIHWSQPVRQKVMEWWREFARSQALVNLHQYDKALDGKRPLEEARSVVQTVIAMRKMLGKRSLETFAEDIGTTFAVLQAMSDSFDPASRQPLDFDQTTVRAELDSRRAELGPEKRKLLAKNLRELAQIITELADNRSKTPLMRREEDFERQIMTGEQQPHSAIDTMKWLCGYLDGAQDKADENSE